VAAVLLVRRDIMVDGWNDPLAGEFGVEADNGVWLKSVKKRVLRHLLCLGFKATPSRHVIVSFCYF